METSLPTSSCNFGHGPVCIVLPTRLPGSPYFPETSLHVGRKVQLGGSKNRTRKYMSGSVFRNSDLESAVVFRLGVPGCLGRGWVRLTFQRRAFWAPCRHTSCSHRTCRGPDTCTDRQTRNPLGSLLRRVRRQHPGREQGASPKGVLAQLRYPGILMTELRPQPRRQSPLKNVRHHSGQAC